MPLRPLRHLFWASLVALPAGPALPQPQAATIPAGQAQHGRALYQAKGCYQCHGYAGQGASATGPALAPSRLSAPGFAAYVRRPGGQMPPYSAKLLPDAELAAITAYVQSLPRSRGAAQIPLLASYVVATNRSPQAPTARARPARTGTPAVAIAAPVAAVGAGVYRGSCSACHGGELQGGAGPSLRGGPVRSAEQVAAIVRNPPAGMPRLFPTPLSEADVEAVAAYVSRTAARD